MTTSRREFVRAFAAAGLLTGISGSGLEALAAPASRLYPPRDLSAFDVPLHHGAHEIRIGYAAIAWNGKDDTAIEEVANVGYPGIQLRANAVAEFPDPARLRDLLASHHLTLVALSSGEAPLDTAKRQETLETHLRNARYLHAAGGKYLQVISGFDKPRSAAADVYKCQGALLTEIGRQAADLGVQTGFHNHMGSLGQSPEAVDAILAAADPRYVKLELDVAHYQQGGGDPASAIHKYGKRLLFLHLKDVRPAATASGYEFVELGQGRVDFPAIFAALRAVHFRGWGVVELDGKRVDEHTPPRQSAEMSKRYLEGKVGIRV